MIRAKQAKNEQLINNADDVLIDIRNAIIKESPENKNPVKIIDIVETILDFIKQQKGKVVKVLTPKQMLQKIPIAHTSQSLLNEIRQFIYSLH